MKIVTVVGARPQFIKAGTVSREILDRKAVDEVIVHTGQHYDANMSDVFFREMKIPSPDYFLGIGGTSHAEMTGQMIEKIEKVLLSESPDVLMIYGDTNSTLAGAIAASKLHINIAHIEAGLRSFNMKMPEEINRILTDRISKYLFCPTDLAVKNLELEGVSNWKSNSLVLNSGDVMQDGALFYKDLAVKPEGINIFSDYVLCTIHRAENTDDPDRLNSIISTLNVIAKSRQVILPLHPRTKKILETGDYNIANLTIIDPVGYLNMVWLIKNCTLVMTDSGGLQKEAYFFKKICVTMRDETEWVELVEGRVNFLCGSDSEKILNAYNEAANMKDASVFESGLYGHGKAAATIVDTLLNR